MYDIEGYAFREEEVVNVSIFGYLADSCHEASIVDVYPGGRIQYVEDPGFAQVFIEEVRRPGSEVCILSLVLWTGFTTIKGSTHESVQILVNKEAKKKIRIHDYPTKFIVVAKRSHQGKTKIGCSVIPSDAPIPRTYEKVFGPRGKRECEKWKQYNCRLG